MAILSNDRNHHLTIDYLQRTFNAITTEPFTSSVTFTSVATSLKNVSPGSLFAPLDPQEHNETVYRQAMFRGAYGILLENTHHFATRSDQNQPQYPQHHIGIPVILMRDVAKNIGLICSFLEQDPSLKVAMFICFGIEVKDVAEKLASLLHMLGNPVGLISQSGQSYSVNRHLNLSFPLDSSALQETESIIAEDGAAALVIAANDKTLLPWALSGTQVDICCGYRALLDTDQPVEKSHFQSSVISVQSHSLFGAVFDNETRIIGDHSPYDVLVGSDIFNYLIDVIPLGDAATRIAISMVLAAGITPESIKKAVSVSQEFS